MIRANGRNPAGGPPLKRLLRSLVDLTGDRSVAHPVDSADDDVVL